MGQVRGLRAELAGFVADVFASVPRQDQREKGECYLGGLMLDGGRKSVEAMASRLPDGNGQNLQQFVSASTWDPVPVRRRIAERLLSRVEPLAWAIDDVSSPKDGRMSVAVAHQYCGALGKQANCQVAVSVHAVSDIASCPIGWRLFLPDEWDTDAYRRARTRIPDAVRHREKWRLALDVLDEAATRRMRPPAVVADAGHGNNALFRAGLADRGLPFVVAIRSGTAVRPAAATPLTPVWAGTGCRPAAGYREPVVSAADLVGGIGRAAFSEVTWRRGSRGAMRSRFLRLRVRPAGKAVRRPTREAALAERGSWDGVLPEAGLLVEWPERAEHPTDYRLFDLPGRTSTTEVVRLAKIRWRIEHDYREMKHALGLDHFEGRSWAGWHHHVTLVTAAHAFLTEQRLSPKVPVPA
ncbi:IS701 family transposase [Streptomyces sp. SID3343]|uniref:IS701 family transposase n=1 Tax=Streptomyces sp. SID3343 TaxID=2690260 RepID=UPI00136CA9D0|nr:IS701 family transposase [Streptomyces sp. SID3343]MYV99958.1 IS701 family transposase [Streptomyces sp. SID3343]